MLAADTALRALALTGSDPGFCAGLDLVELGASPDDFTPTALVPLQQFPVGANLRSLQISGLLRTGRGSQTPMRASACCPPGD